MIDVNLTGVWRTAKAAIPHLIAGGRGGSIILTSSVAGLKGLRRTSRHYVAAKHGVIGLTRTLAKELAPHRIRVNSVHPTKVDTDMIHNDTDVPAVPARTWTHPTPGGLSRRVSRRSPRCRSRGWSRPTSATRCCSWPPTRPGTSRASPLPVDAGALIK